MVGGISQCGHDENNLVKLTVFIIVKQLVKLKENFRIFKVT